MKFNFKQILIPPKKIVINIHFGNYAFKINFYPNYMNLYKNHLL